MSDIGINSKTQQTEYSPKKTVTKSAEKTVPETNANTGKELKDSKIIDSKSGKANTSLSIPDDKKPEIIEFNQKRFNELKTKIFSNKCSPDELKELKQLLIAKNSTNKGSLSDEDTRLFIMLTRNVSLAEMKLEANQALKSFLNRFKEVDDNGDYALSLDELKNKLSDPSFKGKDAYFLTSLVICFERYNSLSKDENDSTISIKDLSKIDYISPPNLKSYDQLSAYIQKSMDENGKVMLPKTAGDINYKEIKQGALGDCYFMSALASMAKQQPEKLLKIIHENKDGSYTVDFADGSVKVDKPTEGELFTYANTDTPVWANIIEKAYAKYKNDSQFFIYKKDNEYDLINEGGFLYMGIRALTGNSTDTDVLNFSNPLILTRLKLITALINHKVVTASIMSENEYKLTNKHAYSITGYDFKNDIITIRNPWGKGEGNLSSAKEKKGQPEDGEFKMSLTEFNRVFDMICYEQ